MQSDPDPNKPEQQSTAAVIWRLIKLTWQYRAGAMVIVLLQMGLLAFALSGLGLVGLGIDVIGQGVGASDKAPRWPFGFEPPSHWSAMTSVLIIAGAVLILAALRFLLERASVIYKALLVRDIVVDLRNAVYDKSNASASASSPQRVRLDHQPRHRDVQAVRDSSTAS